MSQPQQSPIHPGMDSGVHSEENLSPVQISVNNTFHNKSLLVNSMYYNDSFDLDEFLKESTEEIKGVVADDNETSHDSKLSEMEDSITVESEDNFNNNDTNNRDECNMKNKSPSPKSRSESIYCGLLSFPEFDVFKVGQTESKRVILTTIPSSTSVEKYLQCEIATRLKNYEDGDEIPVQNLCRNVHTFQERIATFNPILRNKASESDIWCDTTIVPSIISLTTMDSDGCNLNATEFSFVDEMGIGFREFSDPIVIIGNLIKVGEMVDGRFLSYSRQIGVIPVKFRNVRTPRMYLDDGTAKILLQNSSEHNLLVFEKLVSGIPVALMGICSNGRFLVHDVLHGTPEPPVWPMSLTEAEMIETVFVSDLNIGMNSQAGQCDILSDYLQSLCGSVVEQKRILLARKRAFFLGNSVQPSQKWNKGKSEQILDSVNDVLEQMDHYFELIANSMEVFVMSGDQEPTYLHTLPQPALKRGLFKRAADSSTFHLISNPCHLVLSAFESDLKSPCNGADLKIILTSKSVIKQSMERCRIKCYFEMVTKLLEWGHLCPSCTSEGHIAEETLSLLGQLPHYFVIGGINKYGVKTWNGVKIIAVPSFSKTGTVMILTKSGNIVPLTFSSVLS